MVCEGDLLHKKIALSLKQCLRHCLEWVGRNITFDTLSKSCFIYSSCERVAVYPFIKDLPCSPQ